MSGKHCRLYDENLVHNIMVSTGLSVLEFLKEHKNADPDDICEFIEINAHSIIDDTIQHLNNMDEYQDKEGNGFDQENPESWSSDEEPQP